MFDFYISDIHFGHYNVIKYSNRPFTYFYLDRIKFLPKKLHNYFKNKTVQKMNNHFIKDWNSKVRKDQSVLICGDFSFLNLKETEKILKKLNGKKYLIKGNHDSKSYQSYRDIGFEGVYPSLEFSYKRLKIRFSHYPHVDISLYDLAKKRSNLLKPFSKFEKEDKVPKKMSYEQEREFLKNIQNLNIKDKKDKNYVQRIIRKFIGTRLNNTADILVHGHTHSKKIFNLNMINLSVEAHDYKMISHEDLMKLVENRYDYLLKKEVSNFSNYEISSLSKIIEKRILEEPNVDLKELFKNRLEELKPKDF